MAQYSDIFNYTLGNNLPTTGGGENGNVQYTPRDWMSNDEMQGFKYNYAQNDSLNNYWSYDTPDKYKGAINLTNVDGNAKWDNNYRALPNQGMTKYGPIEDMAPYNPNSKLADPNMYYDDPYYGKITAQKNVLPDKDIVGTLIPKLAMAAGSAWIGGLAAPDLIGGKTLWNLGNAVGKGGLAFGGGGSGGYTDLGSLSKLNNSGGGNMAGNSIGGDLSSPDYFNNDRTSTDAQFGGGGVFNSGGGSNIGSGYGTDSGGFNLGNIGNFVSNGVNTLVNGVGQGNGMNLAGGLMLPGMLAGAQAWNQSDKYRQLGMDAADRADPFGSQRAQYAQRLQDTYTNPQAVLDDPQHQAVVQKQTNAINSRNRASGYLGSGKNSMDLADYQATSDAQYLNQERDQLGNLSGAQFNPANAGSLMMQGGQLALGSDRMALDAVLTPYLAQLQQQYGGPRIQPGGGYPGGGGYNVGSGGYNVGGGPTGGNFGSVGPNGPQMPTVPTGIGSGTWGGNGYPDPGDGSYGPQLPGPDYGNIYGSGSGWGQDVIGGGGGGGSSYIPEGGGDIYDGGNFFQDFDWSSFGF